MAVGRPVVLGAGALGALDRWLATEARGAQRVVVGDENTLRHCLPELLALVPGLREAPSIAVPPGEASKGIGTCHALWSHLAGLGIERGAVLVALGGGVVTDLAGFVGATFKRGLRVVNLPTSLMGMVDAAIGGKTAIDLDGVKNLVGLVRQPEGVYVHPPFLRTLGKRELLNGVAEMLKHGLVADAEHWHAVVAAPWHDLQALAPLVERSAALKCAVVSADPEEHGPRRRSTSATPSATPWSPSVARVHSAACCMARPWWWAWCAPPGSAGASTCWTAPAAMPSSPCCWSATAPSP